ncbi:MAG: hybrid sensor histidine kinase/response regulator [Cupriavidus sp.]|uniref:PAS domain-containing hybrid sensor histidine kinase/response regulator n=1 Tax=Cupriavidus pauculus TaxID=82633 RepID=UPI000C69A4F7|nr:PAS domain S-box protein [Cupriavidus pauculus]MBU70466.1 hybrid sensor histidine kinase/response regulator [Cupriavidus sp.]MCM3605014.1 PAS domain S-box protein [Cupriavidus pauculus]
MSRSSRTVTPDPAPAPAADTGNAPASYRTLVESISDYAIFSLDARGYITSWNAGAARIKGYTREEIIGQHFSRFYTEEAKARNWPATELEAAARLGRFEDEGWRVRKDGGQFWANVVITALRDEHGRLIGFGKVTRDMTEHRRTVEALRQSEETFRLLVESVKDYAIFMLDVDGHVMSWNAGASYIKGYRRDEIVGKHFSVFYTPDDMAAGKPERELATARAIGRVEDEGWRVRKDGSLFWAYVTITAVYDGSRELRGFAKVTRDMSERKRLEELEQSERRMNEFLATLSHELRNPLAPMRNALTVMQMRRDDPAIMQRSVELIDRQMSHMTRLVDDLLDVGRIAAGKIQLQLEHLDAAEIIAHGIEAAEPALIEKSQTVQVTSDTAPMPLMADHTRLVQVMQNLLLNASKFSPPGTAIDISATVRDRMLIIQVIDHGRGIGAHALESVFNLFAQEDRPGSSAQGGLGIGLSLCRSLVEMHGGSIAAASEGAGLGATFTVQLPLAAASEAGRQSDETPPSHGRTRRVLLVDDNRDAADSMAMLLEMSGHTVVTAYDGMEALHVAARVRPDIALIDLAMPGMDGFTVIHALRAMPALSDTRYVALTGFGQASDRAQTAAAGFHVHLVKPVEVDLLLKIVAGDADAP